MMDGTYRGDVHLLFCSIFSIMCVCVCVCVFMCV